MKNFYSILGTILQDGLALNIFKLEELCELSETDHLENLVALQKILDDNNLEITPSLNAGTFEELRNLSQKKMKINLLRLIEEGEHQKQEFKSTAFCSIRKKKKEPGLQAKDYKNLEVLHSTLKTIAAFSNCDGGILLIGVEDNGDICGIEHDFPVIGVNNIDGWELKLREAIFNNFLDGNSLNSFVRFDYVLEGGRRVAIIKVTKRKQLDFLKHNEGMHLYIRQGNRTISIEFKEIEKFFVLEKRF